jgi:hypothetical protein
VARRGRTEQCENGPSALWEGADHVREMLKQTLHAEEGAGKREHPGATLRQQGRLEVRCREGGAWSRNKWTRI